MEFYLCEQSGELVVKLNNGGHVPSCCGETMTLLKAGEKDAALEKHVPVVTREGNRLHVVVGEIEHPMTEAHLIETIVTVQGDHVQFVKLTATDKPEADFVVQDGPVEVYEYCNLHGLWKAEA